MYVYMQHNIWLIPFGCYMYCVIFVVTIIRVVGDVAMLRRLFVSQAGWLARVGVLVCCSEYREIADMAVRQRYKLCG